MMLTGLKSFTGNAISLAILAEYIPEVKHLIAIYAEMEGHLAALQAVSGDAPELVIEKLETLSGKNTPALLLANDLSVTAKDEVREMTREIGRYNAVIDYCTEFIKLTGYWPAQLPRWFEALQ